MESMNTSTGNTVLDGFLGKIEANIINPLITLLALGAFVYFIWGMVEYIMNAANDEKRKIGQQHMLWGLIGLTILFGAAAIVNMLGNTVNSIFQ